MKDLSDPASPNNDKGLPLLFFGIGLSNLLLLCFLNPLFLRLFSPDGMFAPETSQRIYRAELIIGLTGLLLLSFGLLAYRADLFQFLRGRRRVMNIAVLLIILFWTLGLAETVLRILPVPTTGRTLIAYEPSAFSMHKLASSDQDIYCRDGAPRWMIRNGYRGPAFPAQKPEGEIRIVFLGGSFVFNANMPLLQDWPRQVETILKGRGYPNVRVINAGVPGHSSTDSLGRLLGRIHLLEPDYVVLCHAWNDIKYFHDLRPGHSLLQTVRPLNQPTHPLPWYTRVLEKSQLYLRLRRLPWPRPESAEGRLPQGEYADTFTDWGIKQYRLDLVTFVDICRNIGAEPILFTQPRLVAPDNSEEEKERIKYEYALLPHEALCRAFDAL